MTTRRTPPGVPLDRASSTPLGLERPPIPSTNGLEPRASTPSAFGRATPAFGLHRQAGGTSRTSPLAHPSAETAPWLRLAASLVEQVPLPTAVLDESLGLVLVNAPFEAMVGRSRHLLVGRAFPEACALPADRELVRSSLLDASHGGICRYELALAYRGPGRTSARVEVAALGSGAQRMLIVTVTAHHPIDETETGPHVGADLEYDIGASGAERYRLRRVRLGLAPDQAAKLVGRPCHEALRQTDAPCLDCPFGEPLADGPTLGVVRATEASQGYDVVYGIPMDDEGTRVRMRHVDELVLSLLLRARVDLVAHSSGLTPRERGVLEYLLLGRTMEEIATILHVSQHTVKYHQANVLRKLGADSRIDLFRIFFA